MIRLKGMIAIPFAFYNTGGELLHIREVYTNRLTPSTKNPTFRVFSLSSSRSLVIIALSSMRTRYYFVRTSFAQIYSIQGRYALHSYPRIFRIFSTRSFECFKICIQLEKFKRIILKKKNFSHQEREV